jgi:hypothetical protein
MFTMLVATSSTSRSVPVMLNRGATQGLETIRATGGRSRQGGARL